MLNNESYYVLQVGDTPVGQNRHYTFDLAKKEAERLWYKHKKPVTFHNIVGVLDYPINIEPELVMFKSTSQDDVMDTEPTKTKSSDMTDIELLVFEMLEYFDVDCLSSEDFNIVKPKNYISLWDNTLGTQKNYTFEKDNIPLSVFLTMAYGKNIDKHNPLYNDLMSKLVERKMLSMSQFYSIIERRNDSGENHLYLLYAYIAQKEMNRNKSNK